MNLATDNDIRVNHAYTNNLGLFWSASCIVEIAYTKKGYLSEKEGSKKIFRLLTATMRRLTDSFVQRVVTIVAFEQERAVGTLTVYKGRRKLPIDECFHEVISPLRNRGERITYLGEFATNEEFRDKARLSGLLFQEAVKIGQASGTTLYLCVVHPHHVKLYKRLGFTEIGRASSISGLTNAPAVLLQLESKKLNAKIILRMTNF